MLKSSPGQIFNGYKLINAITKNFGDYGKGYKQLRYVTRDYGEERT